MEDQNYMAEEQYTPDEEFPWGNIGTTSDAQEFSQQGPVRRKASPFEDAPYEMHQCTAPPRKKKRRKKHHPILQNWVSIMALTLTVAVVSSGVTASFVNRSCKKQLDLMNRALDEKMTAMQQEVKPVPVPVTPEAQPADNKIMSPGEIYATQSGTVVFIKCTGKDTASNMVMESSGTGFIIDKDGYVVTNCHVISGAETIEVREYYGDTYEAEIVGKDESRDVALLKIDGTDFQTVQVGKDADFGIGAQVVAIGHPLGNQHPVLTVGYVSAKNQVVYTDGSSMDMIQTDAAINSGNSGGPLFDGQGRVIGITTAKNSGVSSTGASIEGVGFAIPIDDVVEILPELKEFGHVKQAYLGVVVKNVDSHAQEYGLPAGAFMEEVEEGMAADLAGIQEKDVIVEMAGRKVDSIMDLTRVLRSFKPGEEVTVKVWRNGEYRFVSIVLQERPADIPEPEVDRPEVIPQPHQMPEEMPEDFFDFFDRFFGN